MMVMSETERQLSFEKPSGHFSIAGTTDQRDSGKVRIKRVNDLQSNVADRREERKQSVELNMEGQ